MARRSKTTEQKEELISFINVYAKWDKGESIINLAKELEINPKLLEKWMEDIKVLDGYIKDQEDFEKEIEIWKRMYLKASFKLDKLESK